MKKIYILLAVLLAGTLCFAEDFAPEVNLEETDAISAAISAAVNPYVAGQNGKSAEKSLKEEILQNDSDLTLEYLDKLSQEDLKDLLLYSIDSNKEKSATALVAYLADCRFNKALDEIKYEALKRVLYNARKLDYYSEYISYPSQLYAQAQVWYDLHYIGTYAPLLVTKTTDIEALKTDYIFIKSGIFSLIHITHIKNGDEVVKILQNVQEQLL